MRGPSTSVWQVDVWGGSLDGLRLGGFTLPESPMVAMPERDGVMHTYTHVEVSIQASEDYHVSWPPSSDATFFRASSEGGAGDRVQCFFDSDLGEGTLPAEVTSSFGPFELGAANLQVRAFGEHLPRGRQALVVLSAAALIEESSGKPVRLVPR